jgi:hypothetical protein
MAMTKKVSEARPYVERALKDEELRQNLLEAFHAARTVYTDLLGDRGVTGLAARVARDRDIQDNLRKTVDELRHAADRIQGKDERTGRNAIILLVGIALGIFFNPVTGPTTRRWVKDRVFGSGDEFSYGGGNGSGSASPAS